MINLSRRIICFTLIFYKARKMGDGTLDTRKIYENASRNIIKRKEENIQTEEFRINLYIMKHVLMKKMPKQEKHISSQVVASDTSNLA